MDTSNRTRWFAFAALLGAVTLGASGTQAADPLPKGELTAVWKIHKIDFTYNSPNIRYACESFEKRISAIMQALGAYSKMAVEAKDCKRQEQRNSADITLYVAMPVEATEENVQAAVNFDSREELVARLREERLPTAEDVKRFPATWRTVTLSNSAPARLVAGDCDLMRVLRDQVFPKLNLRVVGSGMNCGAGPDTRIQPKMRVHALMPART
jgi:hypothetical protein